MKLEQLKYFLLDYVWPTTTCNLTFIKTLSNYTMLNISSQWKVSNYADGYWFIYSNKKSIHETRYLLKNNA